MRSIPEAFLLKNSFLASVISSLPFSLFLAVWSAFLPSGFLPCRLVSNQRRWNLSFVF